MKQLLNFQPVFDPVSKTLDFTQWSGFQVNKLYAVVNLTRNTPIYVPGTTKYGISSVSGDIVTLSFDTTSHKTTDQLAVHYDTAAGFESNFAQENGGHLQNIEELMGKVYEELIVMNTVLATGLNIKQDDIDAIRNDVNRQIFSPD
jgi:hypothetical protein